MIQKRVIRWVLVTIGIGLMLFAAAQPALARRVPYGEVVATIDCTAGPKYTLDWSISDADYDIAAAMALASGSSSAAAAMLFDKGYDGSLSESVNGTETASATTNDPDGVTATATASGTTALTGSGAVAIAGDGETLYAASFTFDCTGGPPGKISVDEYIARLPGTGQDEPYTGIVLMSAAQQAPYLEVTNGEGVMPCGVFDVNGWGRKYVGLADFPACTPPDLTVMCLNDEREWVADTVSDIYLRPDGAELDFTSSQHGICGFFPK